MAINPQQLSPAPSQGRKADPVTTPEPAALHHAPRVGAVQRLLRSAAYRWDRHVMARLRPSVRRFAARYPWAARCYYALCSRAFVREQHAVLAGLAEYEATANNAVLNAARLRRNIHGLEKGLSMQPRRQVFAADYIADTVESLEAALESGASPDEDPGLAWAVAVLREYFAVCGSNPVVDEARDRFVRIDATLTAAAESPSRIPLRYEDLSRAQAGLDPLDLLALARGRKSVRWFRPDPVPEEVLQTAMEIARNSPTACNRQPFRFRVVRSPQLLKKIVHLPMGTAGYADNIPAIIVITGRLGNYFDERDRHLIYIDAALAAMAFIYGLEAQGVNSCCINWPDIESREHQLSELLGLAPDERAVMCMAVGYADPDGMVPWSEKRPVAELLSFH